MKDSKKIAMLRRWTRILRKKSVTAVEQGVGRAYQVGKIAGYYNDMTGKVGSGTLLGPDGIPESEIVGGERVNFPIAVCQYGLALWDLFLLTSSSEHREKFLQIAQWILRQQRIDGSWDAFGPMKSARYTVSSMCQGEGASLLFRAGQLSNQIEYTNAAFRAVDFMLKPVEQGGTAYYTHGALYLEEYPQEPRRSVLNGWIFSIFGLYDATLLNPGRYEKPFHQTVTTLCSELSRYDRGYWSNYDVLGKIASPAYHKLHIALLKVLNEIAPDQAIQTSLAQMEKYSRRKRNKYLAIVVKARQKFSEESDVICIQ